MEHLGRILVVEPDRAAAEAVVGECARLRRTVLVGTSLDAKQSLQSGHNWTAMILSGNRNTSCMTCHHPSLDSDDNRSLSLGEGGLGLGHERIGGAIIPRNAPPFFHLHALSSMFWDQRVRPDGAGGFVTPAGALLTREMAATFDFGVVSAQAMFPVLSRDEMRGQRLTNAPNTTELAL